ncbi:MAG: Endopolygalacturonase [Candidatus Uhrbacteria bacterium GW2011_GWF2_39_13]|uniref:Endopolygalacturonase n=1 Tax=Candidatus Uhrbacteria bacterium GW2011_GWF2_39_13 TaxID=1618995 RepID=A0A0G0PZZ2_9BACT|nr:MAG: Endopolygalacturonase [Candidatus Uhrbacteria bacterium GW2011_GWF2_39_13]
MFKNKFLEGYTDVKVFGANGNGISDDTAAFKKALEANRAKIYIPKGVYSVSLPLSLSSGTAIIADPEARVRLADGAGINNEICLLRNSDYKNGNADIRIEGGTWDLNCQNNPRGEEYNPLAYPGVCFSFIKVKGLRVCNTAIVNPDSFYLRIGETENFHFENIKFSTSSIHPNQDGVHIGGFCRNGVIRNIQGITPHTPNDDMIAINADDDVTRHFNRGMKCGPIENIIVESIKAVSAYTFVRLLSCGSPIRNILLRNLSGSVEHYAVNANSWRFAKGTGLLENIVICDMKVNKLDDNRNSRPLIIINSKVKNFIVDNYIRGDSTAAPTLHIDNNSINSLVCEGLTEEQLESLEADCNVLFKENDCLRGVIDKELVLKNGSIERLFLTSGVGGTSH